jgi:hypothetical protein
MPAHAISQGAAYGSADLTDALAELAAWFGNATLLLGSIRQMIGRKLTASAVRCWPHHFDFATLTALPARNPDPTGYVGAGLSPGDEYYDEPYFYVSVYPEPDRSPRNNQSPKPTSYSSTEDSENAQTISHQNARPPLGSGGLRN